MSHLRIHGMNVCKYAGMYVCITDYPLRMWRRILEATTHTQHTHTHTRAHTHAHTHTHTHTHDWTTFKDQRNRAINT
jgi:hypothetical protein